MIPRVVALIKTVRSAPPAPYLTTARRIRHRIAWACYVLTAILVDPHLEVNIDWVLNDWEHEVLGEYQDLKAMLEEWRG